MGLQQDIHGVGARHRTAPSRHLLARVKTGACVLSLSLYRLRNKLVERRLHITQGRRENRRKERRRLLLLLTERRREADAEENDAQSTAAAAASVRLSGAKTLIGNRERGTAAGRDKRRRGSERTERQGGREGGGKKFPFVIYFRRGAAGRTEVQVVAVSYILSLLQSRAMCIGLAQLWGKCAYLKSIRSEDSIGI